jgi:SAM-dependent methyltransferase
MTATRRETMAGQAVYTKGALNAYDLVVIGVSNPLIWRCPSDIIVERYNRHITANHLEVGVGTGYFLDHCRFPSEHPRVALMDLNPNCLAKAQARIERYNPETRRINVLEPIQGNIEPFDSIGLNYVLHCLPGTMESKAVAFDHLKPLLKPGGVLFGSTILSSGVDKYRPPKLLMALYNRRRIFTNTEDSLAALERELQKRFTRYEVDVVGCVALFDASP